MNVSDPQITLWCKATICSYNIEGQCSNLPLVMMDKNGKCRGFVKSRFKEEVENASKNGRENFSRETCE